MSYNLSNNAFKQVEPILNELLNLKNGETWKQTFVNNANAARLIRQGLHYASVNSEVVGERLASLKHKIRIRVTNDAVIAERKFGSLEPLNKVVNRTQTFPDATTFNDITTTLIKNQHLTELRFPLFDMEKVLLTDITNIQNIARSLGYYTVYEDDTGFTIIKNDSQETNDKEEH